jgi:hypothetical protein
VVGKCAQGTWAQAMQCCFCGCSRWHTSPWNQSTVRHPSLQPHLQHAVDIARVAQVLQAHRLAGVLCGRGRAAIKGASEDDGRHAAAAGRGSHILPAASPLVIQAAAKKLPASKHSITRDLAAQNEESPGSNRLPYTPLVRWRQGLAQACQPHLSPSPTSHADGSHQGPVPGCTGSWGCRLCPAAAVDNRHKGWNCNTHNQSACSNATFEMGPGRLQTSPA